MKEAAKQTNQKMAAYLKTLRQDEQFTMRSLAEILQTPHSFIGKIEQQGRRLDVGEFIHYCRALSRDPADVLQSIMKL
jgi:transcriptional regulator with XRE-family HTH domain